MIRTASQIGRMSRRKGKSFENWVARYFSKWTNLEWRTTRNSGRTDLKGDIYCVSRPELQLVVECKNDKKYSVHAMLKPTKAFKDLFKKYALWNHIIIVKNETGVWFWYSRWFKSLSYEIISKEVGCWTKLQNFNINFEFDGVCFVTNGLVNINKSSQEQ